MNKVIKMSKGTEQGLVEFLKFLINKGKVSGVFTLRKNSKNYGFDYGLITDSAGLDSAAPLFPIMPANGGQQLSSLTPTKKPIAVVLKPCELRGFVERVKREQGSLENVLIISYTCGGVFPLDTAVKNDVDALQADFLKVIEKSEIPENIRPTCKSCEYFTPINSDITLSFLGEKNVSSQCSFYINTERGKEFAHGFETLADGGIDNKVLESHLGKRKAEKEILFKSISSKEKGLDGLMDIFGKCLGCHGCSRVCPICYCVLCDFESHNYDYDAGIFEKELSQKGALRLPADTLFFHVGRLTHMSFSCVGCGQCTDVCPANIPVASVFNKTGQETAALFDYVPGRDLEESIPVMVFKEEEFPELGE